MENIENNKLISKYMQSNEIKDYQKDWNALIEVGEKIESDGYKIHMQFLDTQGWILRKEDNDFINNKLAYVGSIPNKYASNPSTPEFPMFVAEFKCPKLAMYNLFLRFIKTKVIS